MEGVWMKGKREGKEKREEEVEEGREKKKEN